MRRNVRRGRVVLAVALVCALVGTCGCAPASAPSPAPATGGETGAAQGDSPTTLVADFHDPDLGNGWQPTGTMDLRYAQRFVVDYFDGGYALACLADGNRYLVVPEGAQVPEGIADDIQVIVQPVGDVYLAASDSMCLFDAIGAVDRISVSGIERDDWQVASAREAMDDGRIVYGGKYRAPDYELLVSQGVRLAVESTMINHAPEVREKLMELGIPVLVELSSYESEPLARVEWVRLYGLLCGEDDRAREALEAQEAEVRDLSAVPTNKSVAFFYLNANGAAVVRRPGDYVTKMIAQAGGTYAFDDLEAASLGSSTVTLQMERFYAAAKDADVLVYNGTIDDTVDSLDALLAKSELLADFKAVRDGEVWVTEQNMYQQMMSSGSIIADLNRILSGAGGDLTYLRHLD